MTIINLTALPKLRETYGSKKIVFCSGSFDLTHLGHAIFFNKCKEYGEILLVAVGSDSIVKSLKGNNRPILSESTRLKMVDFLKPVDFTLLDTYTSKEDIHAIFKLVFEMLKPDFYIVNEDIADIAERKKLAESFNVNFIVLNRLAESFEEVSTSRIIEKIKKND